MCHAWQICRNYQKVLPIPLFIISKQLFIFFLEIGKQNRKFKEKRNLSKKNYKYLPSNLIMKRI